MKIVFNDNPKTGACDVIEHLKDALQVKRLIKGTHNLNGVTIEWNNNSNEDSAIIYKNNKQVAKFLDGDALRIDLIDKKAQEILKKVVTWDEFIKLYGSSN